MTYLILLGVLYGVYAGLLFVFQHMLMFPADLAGTPVKRAAAFHQPTVLELATDQGVTRGWFLPAPGVSGDRPAGLVVFFHGNAELIDQQTKIVRMYHAMGLSVLLPEYRGYGISEGSPSEKHIVADALAMMALATGRPEVEPAKVVLHGRSIGGGLAAQVADKMAKQHKPAAVIVESTFVSVSGMAWRYGAPSFLVRSPLKTGDAFVRATWPILIMHGQRDQIVPVDHAHELLKIVPDATLLLFDCDHNTLPPADMTDTYEASIRKHLDEAGVLNIE